MEEGGRVSRGLGLLLGMLPEARVCGPHGVILTSRACRGSRLMLGSQEGWGPGVSDTVSCLFQGMLMEGPPGPEGPAVSVVFHFSGLWEVLGGGGWKRGEHSLPFADHTPHPAPEAQHCPPHPPLKRGRNGVLPCGCIFEFGPDFVFNSRVSQDLRERWAPLAKWVTLERG